MPPIYLKNASLILKDRILKNSSIFVSGNNIVSIDKGAPRKGGFLTIDAGGSFVSPGFIDTHIHGFPPEIFRNEIPNGTTSVVIAISCGPEEKISKDILRIKDFIKYSTLGTNVLGIRLEGPYINRAMAGAQDVRFIKDPDAEEIRPLISEYGRLLKIMTMAPELEGAIDVISLLKRRGVIASIGHSDASAEEAARGIRAGAGHVTHLFNRTGPGVIDAALKDRRVWVEAIFDRRHVEKNEFARILKAKGMGKTVLVTDSARALYPHPAGRDGLYRLKDGTTAGSSLTMMGAVRNAVKYGGLPLADAVRLATLNPAALLGIEGRKGSLAPGRDADLVVFDRSFEVKLTMISGRITYRNRKF